MRQVAAKLYFERITNAHNKSGEKISLRITFLLTQSLESPGGGGRYLPLAKALQRLGHEVTMIALHHHYKSIGQRHLVVDGVKVIYVAQMHVLKNNNRKFYFNKWQLLWIVTVATLRLSWYALRFPGDVIHVCKTQPMNAVAAWAAHKLRGVPIVLDSDDYEAGNNRFEANWQQRVVAWFEDWMPSFATGITAGNTFIADRFAALGFPSEQISLVPNAVDKQRFAILDLPDAPQKLASLRQSLGFGPQQPAVVYVGSISLVSHAIDLLLEAFVLVRRQLTEAQLIIAGAGEDFDAMRQLADALSIADCVTFLGHIPSEEIPFYYRLGQVSVDPQRATISAESSLSLKLLESIASGVPCVTTNIGDRLDVLDGAGLAVAPNDAVALAEGIMTVLRERETAVKMAERARVVRNKHWWDERIPEFSRYYPPVGNNESH